MQVHTTDDLYHIRSVGTITVRNLVLI